MAKRENNVILVNIDLGTVQIPDSEIAWIKSTCGGMISYNDNGDTTDFDRKEETRKIVEKVKQKIAPVQSALLAQVVVGEKASGKVVPTHDDETTSPKSIRTE